MRVCVFGSSSKKTSQNFLDSAFKLGELLATRKHLCVNGGGMHGCMGAVNKGARSLNGEILGVIHEKWCVDGEEDPMIPDMIVVGGDDLEDRKKLLIENGDCIIALPGGVGTFDEIWDSVCGKSLGMKGMKFKPICLINTDGFYDGFVVQMDRSQKEGLLYGPANSFFYLAKDVESGLDWCEKQCKDNEDELCSERSTRQVAVGSSRMSKKSDNGGSEKTKATIQSEKSYTTARTTGEDSPNSPLSMPAEYSQEGSSNKTKQSALQKILQDFPVLSLTLAVTTGLAGGILLSKYLTKKD